MWARSRICICGGCSYNFIQDICSYNKEQSAEGHAYANVVTVLMNEKNLTLQQSMNLIGGQTETHFKQYHYYKVAKRLCCCLTCGICCNGGGDDDKKDAAKKEGDVVGDAAKVEEKKD